MTWCMYNCVHEGMTQSETTWNIMKWCPSKPPTFSNHLLGIAPGLPPVIEAVEWTAPPSCEWCASPRRKFDQERSIEMANLQVSTAYLGSLKSASYRCVCVNHLKRCKTSTRFVSHFVPSLSTGLGSRNLSSWKRYGVVEREGSASMSL